MKEHVLFKSAVAFRQALEARLGNISRERHIDILRLRRQIAFDRFLCRLFRHPTARWFLKGGYAMELRIEKSRTTRDIDITVCNPLKGSGRVQSRLLSLLQDVVSTDIGDFFTFIVGEAMKDLDGAPYGGARYPVEARMAGRTFANFHVDVASGDPVLEPIEQIAGRDWLAFAGMDSIPFPAIAKEQQFAEKLHAYTLPRFDRQNTRVRDILDLLLLVRSEMDIGRVRYAIRAIFDCRHTHDTPLVFPLPPDSWTEIFAILAEECGISVSLAGAFAEIEKFISLNRILSSEPV
jgi:hypothetical protein